MLKIAILMVVAVSTVAASNPQDCPIPCAVADNTFEMCDVDSVYYFDNFEYPGGIQACLERRQCHCGQFCHHWLNCDGGNHGQTAKIEAAGGEISDLVTVNPALNDLVKCGPVCASMCRAKCDCPCDAVCVCASPQYDSKFEEDIDSSADEANPCLGGCFVECAGKFTGTSQTQIDYDFIANVEECSGLVDGDDAYICRPYIFQDANPTTANVHPGICQKLCEPHPSAIKNAPTTIAHLLEGRISSKLNI